MVALKREQILVTLSPSILLFYSLIRDKLNQEIFTV